ncbi:hypothetical protein TW95_gp0162 [Pandoravirus inopinatum]|uniref:Uncharacterized protein n=1 Tax=Pandoravirus inopinatum TaxID=1605721 RepID=A0A0B5J7Y6_9VIRU|nr:hypothetical protein TW95_gp0162 [Pandoravirus inopinatum]AJF96896.1 hypothetical protein [Pandoravirus inopinatum]
MFRRRRYWEVWPVLRTARSGDCRRPPIHHLPERITIPSQISFFSAPCHLFMASAVADASGRPDRSTHPFSVSCLGIALHSDVVALHRCPSAAVVVRCPSSHLSVVPLPIAGIFSFSFCRQEAVVVVDLWHAHL